MMHHTRPTPLVAEDAAPTPGHCGPATRGYTQGTNGGSTPRSDRGGDLRGSQGCATILAHTGSNVPKNSLSSETDLRPVAANGSPQTTNGNRFSPSGGHQSPNDIDHTNDRGLILGTARRLRALATIGWTPETLASHLNCTTEHIRSLLRGRLDTIPTERHTQIVDLYQKLSDHPAPPSPESGTIIELAQEQGWSPPIAWDDDLIDIPTSTPQHRAQDTGEPSVNEQWIELHEFVHGHGHRMKLTLHERRRVYPQAVAEFLKHDMPVIDIARRLGVSDREVLRIRTKMDKASTEVTAA